MLSWQYTNLTREIRRAVDPSSKNENLGGSAYLNATREASLKTGLFLLDQADMVKYSAAFGAWTAACAIKS